MLACHDYADVGFAAGFPEAPMIYFDDVTRYIAALRRCRLSVSYRLHSFLPCLAFGTPTIHLSYDERGSAMVRTAGMGGWEVDVRQERDIVAAVMARARDPGAFHKARVDARRTIDGLRSRTMDGIEAFAAAVEAYTRTGRNDHAG
jgi:Polysaccharide pyruvyl transferase